MIRKLRRRMVLVVLIGLLLASAGLVTAINWMNWNSLELQAGQVLDMLAENNGQRPGGADAEGQRPAKPEGTQPPDRGPGPTPSGEQKNKKNRGSKALMNAASMTNYYTATLDEGGRVLSWHSDRTDLYTDQEIADMAQWAVQAGKDRGRNDTRFYCLTEKGGEKLLIVVDSRLEIQNAESVLRLTVLVAVIEDALLSVGAVWLIRKLVKPVDEAMEKQKQFVWDASHELKTPLAVISANADVLAAEAGESKPLQYIQSEVQRTDRLIQNLLTLARMEKGTVEAAHVQFDLSRALLEVALPFEPTVFEEGKSLEMDIPEGIEYTGDEEMIKQLAVILLSNAEKYSDEGGKIRVSLEAKGEKRILRVHNTGPAIPPEAQQRIFDRFYRVDSSHNRDVEGNGLGLAIAQSIVSAHRGKITVHSSQGDGTEFTVTL
ncbi:MAG: HAMP domain-containing histidine kinase [Clostridia bacterium]|nr:HAMP domain-containing histidine kinase [Clostridia bacterium]